MATTVSISTKRDKVLVSCPSEPILARASRAYTSEMEKNPNAFLRRTLVQLYKEYYATRRVVLKEVMVVKWL